MREDTEVRFYVGDDLYTTFEIGEENINFYFAETCAKIAKDMKNNSIKECQLFFFYDGSECEIDFDIMNIDNKYSYINVLFYSVWHNCENKVIKVLTDDDGIDLENITVYFYTRAKFQEGNFEKTCCGRVGFILYLAGNSDFWSWLGQL